MSFSFSQPQTSSFLSPNQLLDLETLANAPQVAADVHQNRMLEAQGRQRDISAFDMEQAGRIAGSVLDETTYPTPEARAAAYPTLVARARANGAILPHAPDTYPGDDAMRSIVRMAVPAKELYAQGVDRTAKSAIAPGDGTGGGGGGGGTGAVGGDGTFAANNPLNIRYVGQPGAANTRGFAAFKTPEEGQAATDALFGRYADSGINTLSGLISKWAPPSENDTAGYIARVAKATGLDPSAPIDLKNPAVARKIQRAMAVVEGNKNSTPIPEAPGSPQTPPGVTMGQVGDQTAPAPPGGTPGAYPAYGGGMGAVIGGQPAAARATIPAGRPTGPPVVTDQPAGSNVVAGPPGVATVGAPQPPGPAVPGNVAAINAGIAGAGGQPVTDPNVTPTPARYAGTAPAPSVEAAPQAGWGTGIGSGYGPQNALAPAPVPPAPAQPATPAAPVATATQPPAADTLPALPAPTPPAPTNSNGLTPFQQQDINRRRDMRNISADELQKRVDSYVATNAAVAEKYQQDQIAYVREARERQSSAQAQQDRAQAQQLAREAAQRDAERLRIAQDAAQAARAKEDREAVEANKPFHGNTPDAQNRNILIEGTNSGKTDTTEYQSAYADYGTEKVDANGLKYRPDMSPYATPTGKTYGDGKGGRDLGKADVGQGPLPPPVIHTAIQGNLAGLRNVDRALKELNAHPDSVGITGLQPDWLSQRTDPEGIKLRAEISDILSQTFHERSGAAVMVSEAARMKPFTPTQVDTAVALRVKLERIRQNYLDTLYDHYSTYGPEGGGRAMPRVEAALKDYSPTAEPANQPLKNTKIKVDANGNIIQ